MTTWTGSDFQPEYRDSWTLNGETGQYLNINLYPEINNCSMNVLLTLNSKNVYNTFRCKYLDL